MIQDHLAEPVCQLHLDRWRTGSGAVPELDAAARVVNHHALATAAR